jgi:hypothetical protein
VLTASLLPLVLFQVVEESPEVGIQDAETIDGGGLPGTVREARLVFGNQGDEPVASPQNLEPFSKRWGAGMLGGPLLQRLNGSMEPISA